MVSAVFHSPLDNTVHLPPQRVRQSQPAMKTIAANTPVPALATAPSPLRAAFDWRSLWLRVLPPVLGLGLLVGLWAIVSIKSSSGFPSPAETLKQAIDVFSDPFYRKGPNDQGSAGTCCPRSSAWPWASAWRPSSASRSAF